jgi:hypothetical protein
VSEILTRGDGTPFERPEKPPADATIEDRIAYMRALAAYNDAVAAYANEAFARSFKP